MTNDTVLDPSGIGEFVNHGGVPMFAKLRYKGDEIENEREWREAFQPLSPLLSEEGTRFEQELYDQITPEADTIIDEWKDYSNQEENNETIVSELEDAANREDGISMMLQAHFADDIGAFYVAGDADLVVIWPEAGNSVRIRIFDIKASWDEKTYHRIQTATYTILLEKLLEKSDVDFEYTIEAGVITRESPVSPVEPETLPDFERTSVESDVRNLVREDGIFDRVLGTPIEEIPYQFEDEHVRSCPYSEATLTHAIEESDTSLLELTRGEQEALQKHGFETLEDLAEVIDPPEKPRPYDYDYPEVKAEHKQAVNKLAEDHGVGERIVHLAQRAQALLGKINPDHPNAHDKPWAPWIVGSGDGSLPDDDPSPRMDPVTDERGSLIRVYLNVQWDYLRDKVAVLAGRVDCANYGGSSLTFSESIDEIPETKEEHVEQEVELLEEFFDSMFGAIQMMRDMAGQDGDAPVHLYFYTETERSSLMDAVKRHPHSESAQAVRDLLGMRAGVDQPMVSVLQSEVEQRIALKTVSTGILPVMEQLSPFDDSHQMSFGDWEYERPNGESANARDIFYYGLFDYETPYQQTGDGIKLCFDNPSDDDGWYPIRSQFDAQIPLEYIWAAVGEFDTSWTDSAQYKGIIEKYMWVDSDTKESRIQIEDVEALSEKFCEALEHVERAVSYKNTNMEKKPIDVDSLGEFTLGETTLADACKDYLDLEYATSKQEVLSHYQQPIRQRILTGKSVPVRITNVRKEDGLLFADCELIYDEFNFASPEFVANACRKSGGDGSSGGSRMVATEIEPRGDTFEESDVKYPDQILHSVPVSIEKMDTDRMTASLRGFPNSGSKADSYRSWHKNYVIDPDEAGDFDVLFEEGAEFILDPSSDDLTSQRSRAALDNASSNTLYNTIQNYINGKSATPVERFDSDDVEEFCQWMVDNYDPSPNEKQQSLITDLSGEVSLLQGPPGTGKTSGAIASALLSRLFGNEGSPVSALVTGASNKSVDEMMEDVSEALEYYQQEGDSSALDDVKLVRLTGEKPSDGLSNVDYVNYHTDEEEMEIIKDRIRTEGGGRQSSLQEHSEKKLPHVVVFATPSRTFGLANSFADDLGVEVEEMYGSGVDLFDLYVADEASMLPLPQLFLGGAFLNETDGWQAIISGDQRQMPPVQKHSWQDEDRRSIEEAAPFLSTLDYFRFLRGDAVSALEDFEELESPEVDIPITRLKETYRCHEEVAEFLRRWVYEQDDIEYTSNLTHTIQQPDTDSEPVSKVLDPEAPITLVLHNEDSSRQSNPAEASIARDLVKDIPASESVGIVTPHNSQKGLLNSVCDKGLVDTVERFQGGERDVMIVSATVSDPDYLSQESEFILNPNRLNVALSRMRKKLIVVAPQTLFEMIPSDVDEYENASIWKGLYAEVEPDKESRWDGDLDGFTGGNVLSDVEADLSIYTTREN